METDEVRGLLKEVLEEEIVSTFTQMLKDSETRMDETNKMIGRLTDTSVRYQDMYDKHLSSLERSRDAALKLNEDLIKANMELTKLLEQTKNDCRFMIQGYKDELHSAKAMYHEILNKYEGLAEKAVLTGRTEAKVQIA